MTVRYPASGMTNASHSPIDAASPNSPSAAHTGVMCEGADTRTAGDPNRGTDTATDTATEAHTDTGGDPACWLNRVCENCGRFVDDPDADVCPACGAHREPHTVSIGLDDL